MKEDLVLHCSEWTRQEMGLCCLTILKFLCSILSYTYLKSKKLKCLKSGCLAKSEVPGLVSYQIREYFSQFQQWVMLYSSVCWNHLLVIILLTSLGIINSHSSLVKICSDVPRENIILWLIFCFVLFSLFVNICCSIMLICVLCLFWLSFLTSPFEFFCLFSSPHIPDFIRASQHLFCKVHIWIHICKSLIVNV